LVGYSMIKCKREHPLRTTSRPGDVLELPGHSAAPIRSVSKPPIPVGGVADADRLSCANRALAGEPARDDDGRPAEPRQVSDERFDPRRTGIRLRRSNRRKNHDRPRRRFDSYGGNLVAAHFGLNWPTSA